MIPTGGWLSTRFGRKRVFVCSLSGFVVASVLCGAADSLTVEVLARIVQGMSGAFLIPLSHAIVLDTYPTEEHGKAMALWGMGSVCGSMIGPTVGGYLTEYASWRWIYYINVPLGLFALVRSFWRSCPKPKRDPRRRPTGLGLYLGQSACALQSDAGPRSAVGLVRVRGNFALAASRAWLYLFAGLRTCHHSRSCSRSASDHPSKVLPEPAVDFALWFSVDTADGADACVSGATARYNVDSVGLLQSPGV
jgi:multidrug resistance protein